jgi:predicted transposase/invertase (TIGR01784 family)
MRGDAYRNIKPVYQIFFLNFELFKGSEKIPRRYFMMEEEEHDKLNEVMQIIFYEMPKLESRVRAFLEGKAGIKTLPIEAKWCIFMRYRKEAWAAPLIREVCESEEGIMLAEMALSKISRDQERWARALFREKAAMDYSSGMISARRAGIELGEAKGYERAALEIARNLKALGTPVEQIAQATNLPSKTIQNL